jgi:predicted RND superfamily exporter protein
LHSPHKDSILDKLSNVLIARPHAVFFSAFTVIVVSAIATAIIPKDLSFTGFLGETEPEVLQFNVETKAFGDYAMLLLLLEGQPEEIKKSIEVLMERLPKESPALSVLAPADPQWFQDRAAWFWPEPILNAVLRDLKENTVRPATLKSIETADTFIKNTLTPKKEAVIVSIQIASSPLDMAVGSNHFVGIERATKRILEESNVNVTAEYTGLSAVGAQDQGAVVGRIGILIPFTIAGILLLVFLIEPRISRVIVAGIALAGSVLIGLALVGAIQGRITLGSAFFGLLLLGLGIDFGIHILVALRDSRAHGMSPDQALRKAVNMSAEPIVLGALSSALAFGVLTLIPNSLTRDMGLTAFFGVLVGMILMLTLLPAGWLILERRHVDRDAPAKLNIPGMAALVSFSIQRPKFVLAIGITLAIVGACGIPRYKTETDLEKVFSNDVPALQVTERIQEIFGTSTTTYTARVENLDQARQWKAELEKLPGIASVSSPTDILPENAEERKATLERAIATYKNAADPQADELSNRIQRTLDAGPVTLETLPEWLKAGVVSKDGSIALSIKPTETTLDAAILDKEIKKIRAVAPTATGVPIIVRLATMGMVKYIPYMMPMVFVMVTLVLIAVFREKRAVWLALVPVVISTAITFGFYFWFDLQFSILTIVVVPVILGLGVDDGIHIVERIRRYNDITVEQLHEGVMGVGRPIFLTTSTTCVSFAALLFTEHSGLESIAHFMLVGIPLCWLTSVTMLPAAVKILMDREANSNSIQK